MRPRFLVLSGHMDSLDKIAYHVDKILFLGVAIWFDGLHHVQRRSFLGFLRRTDPHGSHLFFLKQGHRLLKFPEFHQEGEHALLGHIHVGEGGFHHLKMMVADQIVKISEFHGMFIGHNLRLSQSL